MSIVLPIPKRLTPDQSRTAAITAARALLVEEGVAAITLKSVAARVGRTHANLLHHFGSVAGLHAALAGDIADRVATTITSSIGRMRRGEARLRDVIEGMFDAFIEQGAGELIAWVVLTRQRDALQVRTALRERSPTPNLCRIPRSLGQRVDFAVVHAGPLEAMGLAIGIERLKSQRQTRIRNQNWMRVPS